MGKLALYKASILLFVSLPVSLLTRRTFSDGCSDSFHHIIVHIEHKYRYKLQKNLIGAKILYKFIDGDWLLTLLLAT